MQFLQDEYLDKVLYPIFGSSKRVYGSFGYSILFFLLVRTGAKIGGYAGDGLPTARAFASVVDRLIAHPNILNGALMYWPMSNVLYVEGFGMDQFFSGHWGLRPVR